MSFTARRDAFKKQLGTPWQKHARTPSSKSLQENNKSNDDFVRRGGATILAAAAISAGTSGLQVPPPLLVPRAPSPSPSTWSLSSDDEAMHAVDLDDLYTKDLQTAMDISLVAIEQSKSLGPLDLATSTIQRHPSPNNNFASL
jgi:hypothetical protein